MIHIQVVHLAPQHTDELRHRHTLALRIRGLHTRAERLTQKVGDCHARDRDRILKCEKEPGAAALVRRHLQQVFTIEEHTAGNHLVGRVAHQHVRQGTLAGAIGAHEGMHFALFNCERHPTQDDLFSLPDRYPQITDFKRHAVATPSIVCAC